VCKIIAEVKGSSYWTGLSSGLVGAGLEGIVDIAPIFAFYSLGYGVIREFLDLT